MSIFQVKSVDEIMAESHERGHKLPRVLGSFDVTMIGIGAIIGAGIFAMLGEAAVKGGAGPSLIISIILTAIACGFAALCYAELAAMVPISGSAYTYAYATMGELVAWIIGWDLILEYAIGNVAVAISWSGYFNDFLQSVFGFGVPLWLRTDYHTFLKSGADIASVPHILGVPVVCNLLAVSIMGLLTWVLVRGIKESTRFNSVMVGIKLLVLAIFVCVGIYYFDPKNWTPFAPGGWKGVQVGAAYIFFAYIGFDAVSTVAEETRDPQKNMPIGIIGSLIICTIIYILVTVALTGMMPFTELKAKIAEPLVAGLQYNNAANWLVGLVSFGAVVATTAVLLVFQMGQPRIFFSMSRDGLLPAYFARVHPKYNTPHVTTIWTGIFVAGFASFFSLDTMAELCNIGTLFAFIVVCAGVIVLRVKEPDRPRPFRAPGGYATPVLGIFFCLFLMLGLGFMTWLRFFGWLAVGLVIYFFYGYKNSRLRTGDLALRPPTTGHIV
ncbi:MAG: amino acid permease [Elusimicrobiota bacterium]|nr:amino acid permease [Elusimicrobiota bacterium]